MQELVVISGKGGTGKTSVLAAFAALARDSVLADCDVDAADLHLLLAPAVRRRTSFRSGHEAVIRPERCHACGKCEELCRFGAVSRNGGGAATALGKEPGAPFHIDPTACEGCGVCVQHCPHQAIEFPERVCGEWFVSQTRLGPMVHARLGIAAENSGKLVTLVRQEARSLAERGGYRRILVDGPPGIGCPVIASITGAAAVLAVTEPTLSGEHDLERVLVLCRHFGISAAVCVNKWDLNGELSSRIETLARQRGAEPVGRIPYDGAVTLAQLRGSTVVEVGGPAAEAIREVWKRFSSMGETYGTTGRRAD
jgi:MinD superfamily P-loop ATPase